MNIYTHVVQDVQCEAVSNLDHMLKQRPSRERPHPLCQKWMSKVPKYSVASEADSIARAQPRSHAQTIYCETGIFLLWNR